MGGGLLQRVNRDTMQFATKLNHIVYADGSTRDTAKMPKTDASKCSLPGVLGVKRVGGVPTVFPAHMVAAEENLLQVVYDCRPVKVCGHPSRTMSDTYINVWRRPLLCQLHLPLPTCMPIPPSPPSPNHHFRDLALSCYIYNAATCEFGFGIPCR